MAHQLLFFFLSFLFIACNAADTISANRTLTGNKTLTSNGENFMLGFFTPDKNNHYIAIWYHNSKVSQLTPVWQANRESPVRHPQLSELKISNDGNLVLVDESKSTVWSTDVKIPANVATVAVLLDTGNLQLRDESNSSTVLWQSFDHLTDTWLPGSKFGKNKRTNVSQHLIAWKNSIDPATGVFSVQFDPSATGQYYTMWNNSEIYWASGSWNSDDRSFSNIPEMINNHIFHYSYVNTAEESYVVYSILHNSLIARFVMGVSGQLQQLTWVEDTRQWSVTWSVPRLRCEIYAVCGANGVCNQDIETLCDCPEGFRKRYPTAWALDDYSGGCIRNTPLQCQTDEFRAISNARLPSNPLVIADKSDDETCKAYCLDKCSCSAYSYNNSGCLVWNGDFLHLEEQYDGQNAGTLFLRFASSGNGTKKFAVFWVSAGVLLACLACIAVIVFLICRGQRRLLLRKTKNVTAGVLVRFSYSELRLVTKNFSEKIGGGGFGTVFKGALMSDSTAVAVKKLQGIQQGEKQFRTEVSTIGAIQHVNLVRLYGFCSEASQRLLVYEYMPNGSLDSQLFGKSSTVVDWRTRNAIALGVARGLSYLHEECRDCIIHCDIKPENILLDQSFVPKLADFGLAKLLGRDFSRVLTTLRGTRGYLAPEWIKGTAITAKADVYSFGMMLFEILSGRRNFDLSASNFFPTFAATKLAAGDISSLVDSGLIGDANLGEVERACKVAFWCIQDDDKDRPTMSQIVGVLSGVQDISMPPIPRFFRNLTQGQGNESYFSYCTTTDSSETQCSVQSSTLK